MFLFQFLLVVHFVIALGLVTVVLMQRSEGGGLGMGGSPAGLMSARGAADFLTRATSILGGLFIALSILLAVLAAQGKSVKVDASAKPAAVTAPVQAPVAPGDPNVPFASGARSALQTAPNSAAPASFGRIARDSSGRA
jgi:preprotein translocase subunit SecG